MLIAKTLGGIFMPNRKIRKTRSETKEKSFFVSVFIATLLSLVLGLLLLIPMTLLGLRLEDPDRFTPIFALISLFLTALAGGYTAARIHRENGLLCGALSGILLIGILILLVFAFSLSVRLTLFLTCAPAIVISSAAAGICGVSAGKEKKPKHRKKF